MEHGADAATMYDATAAGAVTPDDAASCSAKEPMSIQTPPASNAGTTAVARDALESLDRPNELGTDAEGAVHFHSPYDGRVVVVAATGEIETTIDLDGRKLSQYLAYVDGERGWDRIEYAESFGEILREAL